MARVSTRQERSYLGEAGILEVHLTLGFLRPVPFPPSLDPLKSCATPGIGTGSFFSCGTSTAKVDHYGEFLLKISN